MKIFVRILSTLLALMICLAYLYFHRSQFAIFMTINFKDCLLTLFLLLAFFGSTGYTFKLLVSLMNVNLSPVETFGLTILTNFGNYLGPTRPGAVLKAIYLKSVKGLPYMKFASVLAANLFVLCFTTGVVATGLLMVNARSQQTPTPLVLVMVSCGLLLGSALPLMCKMPHIHIPERIAHFIGSALEGFALIRSQKKKLGIIVLSILLQFIVAAWTYQMAFYAFEIRISFLSALLIGVFTSVSNLVTITPNNIGIQEAVGAYLFTFTGSDFTTGIIGVTLIRALHILITFGFTPIFFYVLLKKQKNTDMLTKILSSQRTDEITEKKVIVS